MNLRNDFEIKQFDEAVMKLSPLILKGGDLSPLSTSLLLYLILCSRTATSSVEYLGYNVLFELVFTDGIT